MRTRAVGRALGLVAVGGLLLSGCGDVSPGAAADVDGTTIEMSEVDDLANAVCAAEVTYSDVNQQPWQPRPIATYRDLVLAQLVNGELADRAAAELDIEVPASAYETGPNQQLDALLDAMPSDQRPVFEDYLETYGRLQAQLAAIGEATGDGIDADADPQGAAQAGLQYLAGYADDHDVELDPRFGAYEKGQVVAASGSLSAPVEPPPAEGEEPDVDGLPASQVCE